MRIHFQLMFIVLALQLVCAERTLAEPKVQNIGARQWETYCSSCHSMYPPPKLAPPVFGIVMNYRKVYSNRDDFVSAVSAFVKNPTIESSKMPHAIATFKLMPPLPLEQSVLQEIAMWMWESVPADRNPKP